MPAKKPTRAEDKTVRMKTPVPVPAGPTWTRSIGPKATLIVAGCVLAGGILLAARQQYSPSLTTTPRADLALSPETAPATAAAPVTAPMAAPMASTASVPKTAPPVTVVGCLERDGDGFRLKDTTGADAPRSRSWKSGFLKKGPAPLDVVDAAHTLKLTDQIGRRVSVTGTLVDREMHARSLRRVGSSCSER